MFYFNACHTLSQIGKINVINSPPGASRDFIFSAQSSRTLGASAHRNV
jgi:hypothetical protein